MSKEQIKKEAESLIGKFYKYVRDTLHTDEDEEICSPESWTYNAKQCAILEVQSKIDLLEECNKHLKEYGLEMLGKLDHQKEILKYLEEL